STSGDRGAPSCRPPWPGPSDARGRARMARAGGSYGTTSVWCSTDRACSFPARGRVPLWLRAREMVHGNRYPLRPGVRRAVHTNGSSMMVRSRRRSNTGARSTGTGSGLLFPQSLVLGGMAAWLSLIMFNNVVDSGTNIALIGQVLTMEGLIADPVRGVGLVGRALPEGLAAPALYAVIAYQALSVVLLWTATVAHVRLLFGRGDGARATFVGNIA